MLVLPIKKQWFDMILSGEKKEEYRDIKPYYTKRFLHRGLLKEVVDVRSPQKEPKIVNDGQNYILFRNGYSATSPSFEALVSISIGKGNPNWGAEPGIKYYVLHIKEITNTYKCKVGQINKD